MYQKIKAFFKNTNVALWQRRLLAGAIIWIVLMNVGTVLGYGIEWVIANTSDEVFSWIVSGLIMCLPAAMFATMWVKSHKEWGE